MSPEQRRDSSTWLGILEAMEAELERSSALVLRSQHDDVAPPESGYALPANAGPIPTELIERAQHVLEAQHEAIERVEAARRTTGRHLAAMRAVPPHRGERSLYLDTSA